VSWHLSRVSIAGVNWYKRQTKPKHDQRSAEFFPTAYKFQKFGGDYGGRIFSRGFSAAAKISADSDIRRLISLITLRRKKQKFLHASNFFRGPADGCYCVGEHVIQSLNQSDLQQLLCGSFSIANKIIKPRCAESNTDHRRRRDQQQIKLIPRLHEEAYTPFTRSKNVFRCIQNIHANCSTSARCLLAFIQLARRAMVISMLIRRAGGL